MNVPLEINRLPHQPPMRWIRSATRTAYDEVAAEAVLPVACGTDGVTSVMLGLEILAQAAGVLLAAETEMAGTRIEGRLLQVSQAQWDKDELPLGIPLVAKVKWLTGSAIGLHHFSGVLSLDGEGNLLEAEFSLLTPTE
jgi:predicted hotdog family 3-hydroxylacyl-ACP dehydratase